MESATPSASNIAPRIIPAAPGIELRPVTVADAPALYRMIDRNRAYLSEWLMWATPEYSEADLRAFLADRAMENISREALTMAICVDGAICGSIAMHRIDWLRKSTSMGYWLDFGHKGRGVVTHACCALVTEAFTSYGLHRVEIRCATGNDRSAAIPFVLAFVRKGFCAKPSRCAGSLWICGCSVCCAMSGRRTKENSDVSELFQSISQPLQTSATVKAVFGEAVSAHGKTIIPVARVAFGFGGGSGRGTRSGQPAEGEGRGGGGGVAAMPLGVFEVTEEQTRFVPLNQNRKILIAALVGVAFGFLWARRH